MREFGQFVAFVLIGLGASAAHAVPVVTTTSGATSLVTGVATISFGTGAAARSSCPYSNCSGNYQIVNSSTSTYARPVGSSGNYLTVPNPQSNGSATFGLGTTANYFGLLWGSLDTYNSISFLLGDTVVASYTGGQLASMLGLTANGSRQNPSSNAYINFFFGDSLFNRVRLTSTNFAFESDNHAFGRVRGASVPEPGALALFGLGLVGLALRRRRTTA
jgi:hypothetical protein